MCTATVIKPIHVLCRVLQTLKQNTEVRDGNDRTRPKTAITSETANELAEIVCCYELVLLQSNIIVISEADKERPKCGVYLIACVWCEQRAALLQQHKQLVGGGSVGDPLLRQAMPARAGSMRTPATSRSAATIAAGSLSPLSQPKKHVSCNNLSYMYWSVAYLYVAFDMLLYV